MADGSVRFLRTSGRSNEDLARLFQVGGCREEDFGPLADAREGRHLNWPNIAALAVWLLSVGTLLTGAVRSRKSYAVPPPHPPAEVAVGDALGVVQAARSSSSPSRLRLRRGVRGHHPSCFLARVMVVPFSADTARHRP